MAALPSPYVETASGHTIALAGSAAIFLWPAAGTGPSPELVRGFQNEVYIGPWTLRNLTWNTPCDLGGGITGETGEYVCEIDGPGITTPNYVEQTAYPCTAIGSSGEWSDTYAYAETQGPYRLGMNREAISGHGSDAPLFNQYLTLVYAWFGDRNTKRETSFGGYSATLWLQSDGSWSPTQDATDFTPLAQGNQVGFLTFGAQVNLGAPLDQGEFFGLAVAGHALDTSDLDDGVLLGSGSGNVVANNVGGDPGSTASAFAPFLLEYDLDIPKATGGATTGARVVTVNQGTVTCPYTGSLVDQYLSWRSPPAGGREALSVEAAWAAGRPVPWDTDDLTPLLWGNPPGEDVYPAAGWDAVTIALAETLTIAGPEFLIVASVPYVRTQQLGSPGTDLPEWRPWLGVGTLGKADAAFNPDLEGKTKSSGVPWDWSSYGYLWVQANGPDVVTLTLTVTGVYVTVSDSHVTGSQRNTDFAVTETAFEATYRVVIDDPTETNKDYFIDLHFPASASIAGVAVDLRTSGPFYLGRVDQIEITGWSVGTWQLKTLKLASQISPSSVDFPGQASVKVDFGAPVQRGDYDAWHAAHNGAACCANLSDRTNATEHFSVDGRGVRAYTILTGAISGIIQDATLSLSAFAQAINQLEGWTVAYDGTAAAAALSDGTNSLTAYAPDLEPQLPGKALTAGTTGVLAARLMVGEIQPVNGIPFAIYTRAILGHGAMEALAQQGRRRAGAGRTVTLTNGQSGTTDAHGYVEIGSVPANGTVTVGIGGNTVALRAHDKRRLPALLRALGKLWPFNLFGRWPVYQRAAIADDRVEVRRRRGPRALPFDSIADATAGTDARPVLARDLREHLLLAWGRQDDGVYLAESWDDGATFGSETLMIAGGQYPFVAEDPSTGRILLAALVGTAVYGRLRSPARQWSAAFAFKDSTGAAIAFDDADTFAFAFSGDAAGRLVGAFHIDGEDAVSEWSSTDDAATWVRLA